MEPLDTEASYDSTNRTSFRLVLLATFFERIAYYGIRGAGLTVLFIQYKEHSDTIMWLLGLVGVLIAISAFVGGVISDRLLGSRRGMIIGILIGLAGAALTSINSVPTAILAAVLLAVGNGFFRATSFSAIVRMSPGNPERLEKRFISQYGIITLGIFLGTGLLGIIAVEFSFTFLLIAVLLAYAISLILLFFSSFQDEIKIEKQALPNARKSPAVPLVLISIAVGSFWIAQNYASSSFFDLFDFDRNFFQSVDLPYSLIYNISALFILIFYVPYYFLARKIGMVYKFIIPFAFIGLIWLVSTILNIPEYYKFGLIIPIIWGIVEAISELFIFASISTYIAGISSNKSLGTNFGVYMLIIGLIPLIISGINTYISPFFGHILTSVILILSIIYIAITMKRSLDTAREETEDSNPI